MSSTQRRFWTEVSLQEQSIGFGVQLDRKLLRLPGGSALRIESRALAEAVVEEWRRAGAAMGGSFAATDIPLTALAGTLQEHVAPQPARAVDGLMRFVDGELLCYRAVPGSELALLQIAQWQPWLDWIEAETGAALRVVSGVMPMCQSEKARGHLRGALEALSSAALVGLGVLVPASSSLVLGLATLRGPLPVSELCRLSRLEMEFQSRHWGIDREQEAVAARLDAEIKATWEFMRLTDT